MDSATRLINRLYELLEHGNVEHATMLYAPDAEIIRFDGVTTTHDGIVDFWRSVLEAFPGATLNAVDRVLDAGDVVMWDALINTELGILQTVDVVVLDEDGKIKRHIPAIRGFWGD